MAWGGFLLFVTNLVSIMISAAVVFRLMGFVPHGDTDEGRAKLRKRMAVSASGGRQAHTSFRVLQQLKDVARVELRLHTGRTHQIRVHLEHLGCPVLGDLIYGKRQNLRLKQAGGYVAPRQLLHAAKLGLVHPRTHRRMTFAAPLPEDFAVALAVFSV